jgi:hypothetical protein
MERNSYDGAGNPDESLGVLRSRPFDALRAGFAE